MTERSGPTMPNLASTLLELGRSYERAGLLDEAERAYAAVPKTDEQYDISQERLRALTARRVPVHPR